MKKIIDLTDLFTEQLKELLNAERQQKDTLQRFIDKTKSDKLKSLLMKDLTRTEQQAKRLEEALDIMGENKREVECEVMTELLDRGLRLQKKCDNSDVLEAGLITSIQCTKHFEITLYGTLISYANLLNEKGIAEMLKKTLIEEKELDKELTDIALKTINTKANKPAALAD